MKQNSPLSARTPTETPAALAQMDEKPLKNVTGGANYPQPREAEEQDDVTLLGKPLGMNGGRMR